MMDELLSTCHVTMTGGFDRKYKTQNRRSLTLSITTASLIASLGLLLFSFSFFSLVFHWFHTTPSLSFPACLDCMCLSWLVCHFFVPVRFFPSFSAFLSFSVCPFSPKSLTRLLTPRLVATRALRAAILINPKTISEDSYQEQ